MGTGISASIVLSVFLASSCAVQAAQQNCMAISQPDAQRECFDRTFGLGDHRAKTVSTGDQKAETPKVSTPATQPASGTTTGIAR
jgi:hypothetical protein